VAGVNMNFNEMTSSSGTPYFPNVVEDRGGDRRQASDTVGPGFLGRTGPSANTTL